MGVCGRCGNDYDKTFDVVIAGETYTFDSFECAIATVAPRCRHCGCRIIGHGVEAGDDIFCCVHCANQQDVTALRDRV